MACEGGVTHLLVVVVVGVDVVVVLLVSHVLLVAQLAVESGVSFLLHEEMERKEEEVKEHSLCAFAVILSHFAINKMYGLSVYNISFNRSNLPHFFLFNLHHMFSSIRHVTIFFHFEKTMHIANTSVCNSVCY